MKQKSTWQGIQFLKSSTFITESEKSKIEFGEEEREKERNFLNFLLKCKLFSRNRRNKKDKKGKLFPEKPKK